MKTHELEFDTFDAALSQLLQGEEMPSVDFTSRVMAQVAQTPQEKKTSRKVRPRYIATIAACAAVVVLCAPFFRMFGGMGAMKAADSAAPADGAPAEVAMDDAMEVQGNTAADDDYGFMTEGSVNEGESANNAIEARDGEPSSLTTTAETAKDKEEPGASPNVTGEKISLPVVTLDEEQFAQAEAWLLENGFAPNDEGGYALSAEEVALLNAQFPDLELEEMDCILQEG